MDFILVLIKEIFENTKENQFFVPLGKREKFSNLVFRDEILI